jgi:xanthine dehydrogenase accessory factor
VILEKEEPLAIRKTVSLCEAVYTGEYQVEDLKAVLISSPKECGKIWKQGKIPLLIDPKGEFIEAIKPDVLVDGIIAKECLGTHKELAPITIGLGPGFVAGEDVDVVVETMGGHYLGKLYFQGTAIANTSVPRELGGESKERVIYAPCSGVVKHIKNIGDKVDKGEGIFYINQEKVVSPLKGIVRGLIHEGLVVEKGLKCGDLDPRCEDEVDCYSISDKARALGGAVLEATLMMLKKKGA